VSYNYTTEKAGFTTYIFTDGVSWLAVFIGCNLCSICTFIISFIYWKHRSEVISEEVDDNTLTPTDYTLEFHNIPKHAKQDDVKTLIFESFPNIVYEVYTVKKFDARMDKFNDLCIAAKTLKDLRI